MLTAAGVVAIAAGGQQSLARVPQRHPLPWPSRRKSTIPAPNTPLLKWVPFDETSTLRFSSISVGDEDSIWALDRLGMPYHYYSDEWHPAPSGPFMQIATAYDETIIALKQGNSAKDPHEIFWFDADTFDWKVWGSDRDIKYITVGNNESIWGIDAGTGFPCWWDDEKNTWIDGGSIQLQRITCGADDTVWGIDGQGNVYVYDGAEWGTKTNVGQIALASIANSDTMLMINNQNVCLIRNDDTDDWTTLNEPKMTQVAIGVDGTALGIDSQGILYYTDTVSPTAQSLKAVRTKPAYESRLRQRRVLEHLNGFTNILSYGYKTDSINNWLDYGHNVTLDDMISTFQYIKSINFDGVLVGYSSKKVVKNNLSRKMKSFPYNILDAAVQANIRIFIDVEELIKPGSSKELTYENLKETLSAIRQEDALNRSYIMGIHVYGEVDDQTKPKAGKTTRSQQVNSIAQSIIKANSDMCFTALAVVQSQKVNADLLGRLTDVDIICANVDSTEESNAALKISYGMSPEPRSFELMCTQPIWFLVYWMDPITDKSSEKDEDRPWLTVYAAIATNARGIIWTRKGLSSFIPYPTKKGEQMGTIKPELQYVIDILNQIKKANLDSLYNTKMDRYNIDLNSSKLTQDQVIRYLLFIDIIQNPYGEKYYSAVFSKDDTYFLLILNPYNEEVQVIAYTSEAYINIRILSETPKPSDLFIDKIWHAEDKNLFLANKLTFDLPGHEIALFEIDKKGDQ